MSGPSRQYNPFAVLLLLEARMTPSADDGGSLPRWLGGRVHSESELIVAYTYGTGPERAVLVDLDEFVENMLHETSTLDLSLAQDIAMEIAEPGPDWYRADVDWAYGLVDSPEELVWRWLDPKSPELQGRLMPAEPELWPDPPPGATWYVGYEDRDTPVGQSGQGTGH